MSATDTPIVVTDELAAWLGRSTPSQPLVVITEWDVRRYADATGDHNPLWLDDAYAVSCGFPGRLLPPTLVGWLPFSLKEADGGEWDLRHQLPLPPGLTNVRNAGSRTEWLRWVCLGEALFRQDTLVDIAVRTGRAGTGYYVSQEESVSTARGERVLVRHHTMAIFPECSDRPEENS